MSGCLHKMKWQSMCGRIFWGGSTILTQLCTNIFLLQRCDHDSAHERNHFPSTDPGSCCPSRLVQGFEGDSVSIPKCGQPTQTHEERLGHPPNQRPRELTGPVPARACPGNSVHPCTYMCQSTHDTHAQLSHLRRKSFLWQPCTAHCPEFPLRGPQTCGWCLQQNASYLQHFAKGQGSFTALLFIFCFRGWSAPL